MATAQKLYLFWRHQKALVKWKIQVYNAVVISQLVYGLNTVYFTESLRSRIDAFQFRGLRAILGIEHSYWSHISNDEVLERANTILQLKRGESLEFTWEQFKQLKDKHQKMFENFHKEKIIRVTELIERRQIKLLGHILRLPLESPERMVTVNSNGFPVKDMKRRVGQPRKHWTMETMKNAFYRIYNEPFEIDKEEHRIALLQAAQERKF